MSEHPEDMTLTYGAFISYRHLPADIAAAKAVQRALETYRIPGDIRKRTGRKKLNRCFRDQDELPLADDLGSSIEKALRDSEWLVVICSPDLPESKWCLREVDYFISLGRRDRIIPVLISGEPADSYPPQLTGADAESGREETEPLAADLRGDLKKQLKTEKMRIAARMLNVDFNDLKKRERERALRRGLALVSCALAATACFTAYAVHKNNMLTEERNATARNATELLIEKSLRSSSENELGRGLTYALQAYEGSRLFEPEYDPDVSAALEAAMYPELYSQIGSLKDNGILHTSAFLSNDGKLIACRQADSSLQIYSSMTGERLFQIRNGSWFWGRPFSPDGRYISQFTDTRIALHSSADGTEILTQDLEDGWIFSSFGLTACNEVPVNREEDGAAGLYDPFTKKIRILEGVTYTGNMMDSVLLHRSGTRGVWYSGDKAWIVDTENARILLELAVPYAGEYTQNGLYYIYNAGEEYAYLRWDTAEEVLRSGHGGELSPDGKLIASTRSYSGFTVYDAATGDFLWEDGHDYGHTVYSVTIPDNDTLIASHGEVQVYRLSDRSVVYSTGEDRATYGFDCASGRLVLPLRSGGCLVNLMPEEKDILPHLSMETRAECSEEDLAGITEIVPLAGNWNGSQYWFFDGENFLTIERDEPGLVFIMDDQEYVLHPVNGIMANQLYISPDKQWQALIRGGAVDIFRVQEGPEPVLTIPENGYDRLCAAICGNTIALGSYVENLAFFDLLTGDCLGTIDTGAMCQKIQFSPDGKHIIAASLMASKVTVANTDSFAVMMKIPITDIYADLTVGFNSDGTEATVIYPDGHADVGLLYQDLDTLVEKAKKYAE